MSITSLSVLCLTTLALLGCGTSARTSDAGPGDASSPLDAATSDGSQVSPPAVPYYEVPTTDPALAPHAFFALADVHYVTTGGTVELTYDFPPALSGVVDQPLVFTGPVDAAGNATISGATGSGSCVVSAGIVRCTETFTALALDTPAAVAMADGYSSDAAARAARADVVQRFASDPIGIVVFDLATASEPSGGD